MILPDASDEQKDVVNAIKKNNVIVDSVAGSGKTTCILHIANAYPKKSILLLTYNAKLKFESREKALNLNLTNIEIHSYHAFCYKYYSKKCSNDNGIIELLKNSMDPQKKYKYDLIILDEAQDINELFYKLVYKIYNDNIKKNATICLLGDQRQSIYQFNGADERFIAYGDQLFNWNEKNFVRLKLSQTFRLTEETATFVNNCMLKSDIMISNKHGKKPKYIICDCFKAQYPYILLKDVLGNGYSASDIFVLAPSIKKGNNGASPIKSFENMIRDNFKDIQVYIPISDDEKIDEDHLKNKIVFSTFHQAKGLERPIVFIFGFDDSYFKYHKKDRDVTICPNELYVATTRAIDKLFVFHHYTNNYLQFINSNKLKKYADVVMEKSLKLSNIKSGISHTLDAKDIVKYLPSETIYKCMEYLTQNIIKDNGKEIKISTKIKVKSNNIDTYEAVSAITSVAIRGKYELMLTGSMRIYNDIRNTEFDPLNKHTRSLFVDVYSSDSDSESESDSDCEDLNKCDIDDILTIAKNWISYSTGYKCAMNQINDYNWLNEKKMNECTDRLMSLGISKNALFENNLMTTFDGFMKLKITGTINCVDKNNYYMFKFGDIKEDDILYLSIIMYIVNNSMQKISSDIPKNKSKLSIKIGDIVSFEDKDKYIGTITNIMKNDYIEITTNDSIHEVPKKNIINNINKESSSVYNFYIYNVINDKMIKLECDNSKLNEMIKYLLKNKLSGKKKYSDTEFINNMNELIKV